MFHFIPRRPLGRYERIVDPRFDPSRATLEDRKLESWALMVGADIAGEHLPGTRRSHRAFLPDVDFSQIVERPKPAWRRLIDRFL